MIDMPIAAIAILLQAAAAEASREVGDLRVEVLREIKELRVSVARIEGATAGTRKPDQVA